jgi:hypothetical protein
MFDDSNVLKVMVRNDPGRNPEFSYIDGQYIKYSNEEAILYTLFPDAFEVKYYGVVKSDDPGRWGGDYIEFVQAITSEDAKNKAKNKDWYMCSVQEITKADIKKIVADAKKKADEATKTYETLAAFNV